MTPCPCSQVLLAARASATERAARGCAEPTRPPTHPSAVRPHLFFPPERTSTQSRDHSRLSSHGQRHHLVQFQTRAAAGFAVSVACGFVSHCDCRAGPDGSDQYCGGQCCPGSTSMCVNSDDSDGLGDTACCAHSPQSLVHVDDPKVLGVICARGRLSCPTAGGGSAPPHVTLR